MKKSLVLLISILMSSFAIGSMITLAFNMGDLRQVVNEQSELIETLQPSDTERYMDVMLEGLLLDETFIFTRVGSTTIGSVEDWDYAYIILETDRAMTIEITTTVVAPYGDWNLNIYFGAMSEDYDISYDELYNGDTFTVTIPVGFTTIEFDSYSDNTYPFSIVINEVL